MAKGSLEIRWDTEGERQLARRLENVTIATNDFGPAFQKSTDDLKRYFEGEAFESQGSALGEPWPPLTPFTVKDKIAQGYGNQPPLVRTREMRDSFRTAHTKDQGEVWNEAEYFKYHQSRAPRTRLPRRIMMKLNEFARQTVIQNLRVHLRNALK